MSSTEREARSIKHKTEKECRQTQNKIKTTGQRTARDVLKQGTKDAVRAGSIHRLISDKPGKSCCFTRAQLGQPAGVQLTLARLTLSEDDSRRRE